MTKHEATLAAAMAAVAAFGGDVRFPDAAAETKPWGICHLLGNAAEIPELEKEMQRWADGGLGGVRLVPIYCAKGWEEKSIPTMSPEFVALLRGAKAIAAKHGLGLDMSFGAGWCFGGKHIPASLGVHALKTVKRGEPLPVNAKTLFETDGATLVAYPTGQMVKRAQPSDAGPMLNPFSPAAMEKHLGFFGALDGDGADAMPRGVFHDSFEYFGAGWSDEFPALFRKHRGYSIEDRFAELAGIGDPDGVARVKCDYRETLSDILVNDTFPLWTEWCRKRGVVSHNQAHGAPANLLEFYALADEPETEMFGRGGRGRFASGFDAAFRDGDRSILMSKFASSAAHLAGRRRVSAEAFTWMAEHFCETLEETKAFGDLLFLSGVNRLYFHATVHSPDSAPWPGWCFYAASELNPRNPVWRDIRPLNDYFARVQSLMADAEPDNDVLLYWPVHDQWSHPGGFAEGLSVHSRWIEATPFGDLARRLADAGFQFDYVSDKFLTDETVARCKAIVVPECRHMKGAAFRRLAELSRRMPVIFEKSLPATEPGLLGKPLDADAAVAGVAPVADAVAALAASGAARREPFAAKDTPFDAVRMKWKGGRLYFVVNSSMRTAKLAIPRDASCLDPLDGDVSGGAGCAVREISLSPAQSMFVFPLDGGEVAFGGYGETGEASEAVALDGTWSLEFTDDVSGWKLPPRRENAALGDWTELGDAEAEFSGTAVYSTTFRLPEGVCGGAAAADATLDLGEVRNSVRVKVNGVWAGGAFMHPYRVRIPAGLLRDGDNELELRVTNLGANRIRAYDRRGVEWKVFTDANVVDYSYRPLDASTWPVVPSGLLGPVKLAWRLGRAAW